MRIVEYMERHGHEQLAIWTDPAVGLKAFIAIHDTTLGPALGGIRIWPHRTEDDAVMDVLRLSRAMTYKSAVAGLPLGGGKGLIMADSRTDKSEAMFRSFGRFVESLGGRYVATEDVGATTQDLEWLSFETSHVVGLSKELGGSGNPSTMTGYGVYLGMKACAKATWGSDSLSGRTVAIQGFGNVATSLTEHLLQEGAKVIATDIVEEKRLRAQATPGVTTVEHDHIFEVPCDIFAPCALGGIINATSIPWLRCKIVCGGANNQLAEDEDAHRLALRGILYAPDYVVNAGGVINVYYEFGRPYNPEAAKAKTSEIYNTMERVISISRRERITTAQAADRIGEQRVGSVKKSRHQLFLGN